MKKCYMLIGLPGVGKSSLIEKIKEENQEIKIISTDKFIDEYAAKRNETYEQVYQKYYETALSKMKLELATVIKNKENFIWDQTNTVLSARLKKIKNLINNKYEIIGFFFELSNEEHQKRLKKRVANGGKKISPKLIENMKKEYIRPLYSEGFYKLYEINDDGIIKELEKENNKIIDISNKKLVK